MNNRDSNKKQVQKTKKKSKIRKANTFLAFTVIILLVGVLGSLYYVYSKNKMMKEIVEVDTIYNNIYINNIDMGGLTVDKAKDMLATSILKPLQTKKIIFTYEDKNWELSYENLKANYNIDKIVEEAYNIGRNGELEERYEIVQNLKQEPKKFELEYEFDQTVLAEFVKGVEQEINIEMKNSEMQRVNGKFTGTKEQIGQKLNSEQAVSAASDAIKNQKEEKIALVVDKLEPQYTQEFFEKMNNVIGTFSTIINNSAGGTTNIKIASSRINDKLMYPGDILSYYETLGPTTAAAGFQLAPIIVNGQLEDGLGGGVCQVSSTLYNSVLLAELEIVERHNHSRPVGYVQKGMDATMAGDYLDFKFKNSTEYPIYIESYVQGNKLTVTIYGNEIHKPGRTLKFESVVTQTLEPPAEKVIEDSTLAEGTRKVTIQPKSGYVAKVYKYIYQDGKLLEKSLVNTSTYKAVRGEVRVGVKKKSEVETQEATVEQTTAQQNEAATQVQQTEATTAEAEIQQPEPATAETEAEIQQTEVTTAEAETQQPTTAVEQTMEEQQAIIEPDALPDQGSSSQLEDDIEMIVPDNNI